MISKAYCSGHTAQVMSMGFMHANKSSDLLAWWTLDKATRPRTHASLRLASEQVSSRFRTGFGPASIMDFGLYMTAPSTDLYLFVCLFMCPSFARDCNSKTESLKDNNVHDKTRLPSVTEPT